MSKTAIIILAAGNSSRMGEPKQLMTYNNKSFLQHVIDEGENAGLKPVICVTGYEADRVKDSVQGKDIQILYNEHWQEGMGTGIALAIKQIVLSGVDSVVIAVSDQPFISSGLFRMMIEKAEHSGKGIVACSYAGTLGTPVLFSKPWFKDLALLTGNQGAKNMVKSHTADVCELAFERGSIDIDTKQDYEKLISEN